MKQTFSLMFRRVVRRLWQIPHEQLKVRTYYITPKETKEDAVITVKGTASTGSTNMFDITELVIAGVGNTLAASDWPDDDGGYIELEWTASANHAGNGDPDVTIDYYQIYAGLTNDIGAAALWGVLCCNASYW